MNEFILRQVSFRSMLKSSVHKICTFLLIRSWCWHCRIPSTWHSLHGHGWVFYCRLLSAPCQLEQNTNTHLIQYQFGFRSCFHRGSEEIALGIGVGVIVQFLCAYVTLPLYALVTQVNRHRLERQIYLPLDILTSSRHAHSQTVLYNLLFRWARPWRNQFLQIASLKASRTGKGQQRRG